MALLCPRQFDLDPHPGGGPPGPPCLPATYYDAARTFMSAPSALRAGGRRFGPRAALTSTAGSPHRIKVVTYNILANKYALGG